MPAAVPTARPATCWRPTCCRLAEAIGRRLEGRTARQQNPHPKHSLAWLSWIVARCGGWNCYYKPPGPKTMRDGWDKFAERLKGYAQALDDLQTANA